MMDRKQLIHEEEVLIAFGAYLSARQRLLNKKDGNQDVGKVQLLNKCWESLASARKKLDWTWAKNVQ